MKKLFAVAVTALLCCCATLVSAQNKIEKINMTYGEELPDDGGKIVKIVGETKGKIYALVLKGKSDYFLKIFESGSMKQLSKNPIIFPELKDKELDFEEMVLLNDKLYVIGSVFVRSDKTFSLVAIPIDEKGKMSTKTTLMFESKVANKSDRGGFYFRKSPDEQVLLVMHTSLFEKEDSMKYETKLFDENMASFFSVEDVVKYDDNKKDYEFTISDFDVNVNDDVFIVVNEGYRDKKKKEKVEKVELHLYKKANGYKKDVVKVDIVDKEIINCKMLATNKGTVKLTGFFSSVRESGRANKELKGIYNITINVADNTVGKSVFNEFDYATKVKLIGERRAKKGKDVKPLYNIQTIIEKNDGGLIVLSEYQMVVFGQRQGIGPLGFQPITYITNEIIVTSLRPDGTFEWGNVVPKEQSATITAMSVNLFAGGASGSYNVALGMSIPVAMMGKGPEYLSFIPIYKNGQLNILINDHVKNKGVTNIEEIRSMGNYNNAVPSLFVFDNQGNMSRKDPDEVIKNELVIRPGVYCRKSEREFIIYASRKSNDKLGRMILED
ncbi:hypothetical protein [Flavobacterium stagni]|uniref:Uncharacterized protein n=1 Tax=Flavobacterium stagni TaxID=2506421 RepID=A0A4Q1K9K1_9FLAO|nr:hypothetical protein [Flavobacterium stagni]RXR22220.1 hypothetical protein EQG61_09485 [Flavobacterium stagni]